MTMKPLFLLLLLASFNLHGKTLESSENRTALVELYTSEGCSSCPPAEHWLNQLSDSNKLWNTFVPVAFHVDYWDYLGWRDKFANKKFSHRQRLYAAQAGERTVYTPGIRVGGSPLKGWNKSDLNLLKHGDKVGKINLTIDDSGNINASFDSKVNQIARKEIRFNVALLGMNLSTEVSRGENHGRTLNHDFVVLEFKELKEANLKFIGALPLDKYKNKQLAIAAWVDTQDSLIPIQATGGFLN